MNREIFLKYYKYKIDIWRQILILARIIKRRILIKIKGIFYLFPLLVLITVLYLTYSSNLIIIAIIYIVIYILVLSLLYLLYFTVYIPSIMTKFTIFYNREYKNIFFNQKALFNHITNKKNIILVSLTSFNNINYMTISKQQKQIEKEKEIIVPLAFYKLMKYFLSKYNFPYIIHIISFLLIILIFSLAYITHFIEFSEKDSKYFTFFIAFLLVLTYYIFSYFVFKYSSQFYKNLLPNQYRVEVYDNYFLYDFRIEMSILPYKKIYKTYNRIEKEINKILYLYIGASFWLFISLVYRKIFQ